MTKEKFIENFKLLLIHLREITEKFCVNEISENFKFILEPSERNESLHLSKEENNYIKVWNDLENKEITFDQVVDLFYRNGKTPKWADCNIYLSTSNKTVVKIFFSREFRDEEEIYYLDCGTGPFKAVIETNFENEKNQTENFDVNWKANIDTKKSKTIFSKLKSLLNK